MGVLSIPWCHMSMEPPRCSFTARCTVSDGFPVAVEIFSAITLMDWVRMISTKFSLNVVQRSNLCIMRLAQVVSGQNNCSGECGLYNI